MDKKQQPATELRQLAAEEIEAVSGGYGGYTPGGIWVTCGSTVLINGTIYVGGINGPIAMPRHF